MEFLLQKNNNQEQVQQPPPSQENSPPDLESQKQSRNSPGEFFTSRSPNIKTQVLSAFAASGRNTNINNSSNTYYQQQSDEDKTQIHSYLNSQSSFYMSQSDISDLRNQQNQHQIHQQMSQMDPLHHPHQVMYTWILYQCEIYMSKKLF